MEDFAEPESQPINPVSERNTESATPNKQKASKRVGESGLPDNRPVPDALASRFQAIDENSKNITPAFLALEKALIDKAGANGVKAYARIIEEFRRVIPKGTETVLDIKMCLLDLYDELQAVEHPLGDLVEQS